MPVPLVLNLNLTIRMEQKIWKDSFNVRTYEANLFKEFDIISILNRLQDAASSHAEKLGFGWDSMHKGNYFWVLSRLVVEIESFPKWMQELELQTWPKSFDKLAAYRDFEIFDQQSKDLLIRASSMWMVLDAHSHRPIRMTDVIINDNHTTKREAILEKPQRIRLPKETSIQLATTKIFLSDLDMNMHANNVAYARKIIDAYSPEFMHIHKIKKIELNFTKEALYNQTLFIYLHNELTQKTHFLSLKDKDDNIYLAVKIDWAEILD